MPDDQERVIDLLAALLDVIIALGFRSAAQVTGECVVKSDEQAEAACTLDCRFSISQFCWIHVHLRLGGAWQYRCFAILRVFVLLYGRQSRRPRRGYFCDGAHS